MGKYLDIARAFEARFNAEGQSSSVEPVSVSSQSLALATEADAERFLARHVSTAALESFPEWEGLLIKSAVLDMSVWVVRDRKEGEELARESGHPALLLDDVLRRKGKTPEEVRESLLPILITGTVQ